MQIKPDMLLMLMWQDAVDWLGTAVGAGRKRLTQVRNLEGDPCSCISFQREGCTGKQLSVTAPGALSQLSRTVVFINISGIRSSVTLSPALSLQSWVSDPGLCPRCEISSGNYKCGISGGGGELDRHS